MKRKTLIILIFSILVILLGCWSFNVYKDKQKEIKVIKIKKEKLDKKYENISFVSINEEYIIFSDEERSYCYNLKDRELKKLDYLIVSEVENNYIIQENSKYGVVNKEFKVIFKPIYDSITASGLKDVIIGKRGKLSYLISLEKREILKQYEEIYPMDEDRNIHIIDNSLHGYLNEKLEEVISGNYIFLFSFKNKLVIAYNGKKYGVINKNNEIVVPFIYDEIYLHKNGNILVKDSQGYTDFKEKKSLLVDTIYPSLSDYLIYEKDNRFGILDLETFEISNTTYEELSPRVDGNYIIVAENERYGIASVKDFEKKVTLKYDYISPITKDVFVGGTLEKGLNALIIPEIKETAEIYDKVQYCNNYYLGYRENENVDVINQKGDTILTVKKSELLYINEDIILLNKESNIEIILKEEINK
ncbi:WG repeat-containing protein [Fusobacterium sp. SYSU M8D902]|uniref:WG repeat-containing protein n=1 Tax=Fusobacterium sp. SYSU M8D902 TaxID=3159562 RepID=UPI0032E3C045